MPQPDRSDGETTPPITSEPNAPTPPTTSSHAPPSVAQAHMAGCEWHHGHFPHAAMHHHHEQQNQNQNHLQTTCTQPAGISPSLIAMDGVHAGQIQPQAPRPQPQQFPHPASQFASHIPRQLHHHPHFPRGTAYIPDPNLPPGSIRVVPAHPLPAWQPPQVSAVVPPRFHTIAQQPGFSQSQSLAAPPGFPDNGGFAGGWPYAAPPSHLFDPGRVTVAHPAALAYHAAVTAGLPPSTPHHGVPSSISQGHLYQYVDHAHRGQSHVDSIGPKSGRKFSAGVDTDNDSQTQTSAPLKRQQPPPATDEDGAKGSRPPIKNVVLSSQAAPTLFPLSNAASASPARANRRKRADSSSVQSSNTTAEPSDRRRSGCTLCSFPGCPCVAQTGGTPHCAKHGGGRRCLTEGCAHAAAKGGLQHCIKHGGGKRCEVEGCPNGAARGLVQRCLAHGGGKRCQHDGCDKAAANAGLLMCIAHGGGKRCTVAGCTKSAVNGGGRRFCIAHGGGKRCLAPNCKRSAVSGGTQHCSAHGGGKRCTWEGCDKGAESGGTQHCVAHGGGKRCTTTGCNRVVARGGDRLHCSHHGASNRCAAPGCRRSVSSNSATGHCAAHGQSRANSCPS